MFRDLYDNISFIFSWTWPTAEGEVTAVDVRRLGYSGNGVTETRLVIVYKFSVGNDGPYTGESYWPQRFGEVNIMTINEAVRVGKMVVVRYRRDDPSINKLDISTWQEFSNEI